MIFFTSDHHFGHENIISFSNRPFNDLHHMHASMTARWNNVVHKDDVVFHLGDFAFKQSPKRFIEKLNGHIHLIIGNHDKPSQCKGLFESVEESKLIKEDGHSFYLHHYPHESWPQSHYGSLHLHGHVHINSVHSLSQRTRRMNVNVELWEYTPIPISEVIKTLAEQKVVML